MKIAKKCKCCGDLVVMDRAEFPKDTPEPVLNGEQVFWLRFWVVAGITLSIISGTITWGLVNSERINAEQESKLLQDPAMKIEIQELPNSRPMRKFTRESAR